MEQSENSVNAYEKSYYIGLYISMMGTNSAILVTKLGRDNIQDMLDITQFSNVHLLASFLKP